MGSRAVEAVALSAMAVAVFGGGGAFLAQLGQLHGIATFALGVVGVAILWGFRQRVLRGGTRLRVQASRDGAFLAAIAAASVYVLSPVRWAAGAAIVAMEIGIVVELLTRVVERGVADSERGSDGGAQQMRTRDGGEQADGASPQLRAHL